MGIFVKMLEGVNSVTVMGMPHEIANGVVEVESQSAADMLVESFGGVIVEEPGPLPVAQPVAEPYHKKGKR